MSRIDVASARSLIAANPDVLVVDVRTPAEFASAHINGAINLPLDQIDAPSCSPPSWRVSGCPPP
ncbi:rhodanese-like domain-containing protein [Nonomuraea sp. NPDC026600]|uniref:rhodanese-like domain-containing protein n=1 Tax=Nonomuraea sp. NPDC026600 TaxID=3155363 RepID=UPI00340BF5AC